MIHLVSYQSGVDKVKLTAVANFEREPLVGAK